MFVSKRNIYNDSIESVAANAMIQSDPLEASSEDKELLFNFINTAMKEINDTSDSPFNIIIPYQYHGWLQTLDNSLKESISVRANVRDGDVASNMPFKLVTEVTSYDDLRHIDKRSSSLIFDKEIFTLLGARALDLMNDYPIIVSEINKYEVFNNLKSLGVKYFEGNFIEKPQLINQCQIPTNKISVLKLISTLSDPNAELEDLTKIIIADSVLSYKLLRIVNSPMFRGINQVTSIHQAIVRFGFANLKKWVLMLSLCEIVEKPKALIKIALQRALMCQRLAEKESSFENPDNFYTAGLLSTLDALIDHSMENLLKDTALTDCIKEAILTHEGEVGRILKNVISYQRGERDSHGSEITRVYVDCASEVNQVMATLMS